MCLEERVNNREIVRDQASGIENGLVDTAGEREGGAN